MEYSLLRARARENLRDSWPVSIAVAAIAAIFGALMSGSSFLPQLEYNIPGEFLSEFSELLKKGLQLGSIRLSVRNGVLGFAQFILGGVIQLGYAKFLLKQHDGGQLDWKDLFSEFERFGTGFAQAFLRGLYVALWSLLFVIPGIVKSFSYAMTPYILAENPDLTANEAITRSQVLMDGHKGDLFFLRLTFIGWDLLAMLTANLGYLVLNPYQNAAEAAFYRQLLAERRYTAVE